MYYSQCVLNSVKPVNPYLLHEKIWKLFPDHLFIWEEIPGNGNGRLLEFLIQKFGVEWVKAAKIKKNDDCHIIMITDDTNFISLTLNYEKAIVNLEIDDGRTYEFFTKQEDGKLNIYEKRSFLFRVENPGQIGVQNILLQSTYKPQPANGELVLLNKPKEVQMEQAIDSCYEQIRQKELKIQVENLPIKVKSEFQ